MQVVDGTFATFGLLERAIRCLILEYTVQFANLRCDRKLGIRGIDRHNSTISTIKAQNTDEKRNMI